MKINFKINFKNTFIFMFCLLGIFTIFYKLQTKNNIDIKSASLELQSEDIAKSYIISKGYKITSFEGEVDKNLKLPYKIEQNIKTYKYIVTNHPLEKIYNKSKNKIEVYIVVDDVKVVAAYSSPIIDNPKVLKQFYTIDGNPLIDDPKIVYPDVTRINN